MLIIMMIMMITIIGNPTKLTPAREDDYDCGWWGDNCDDRDDGDDNDDVDHDDNDSNNKFSYPALPHRGATQHCHALLLDSHFHSLLVMKLVIMMMTMMMMMMMTMTCSNA